MVRPDITIRSTASYGSRLFARTHVPSIPTPAPAPDQDIVYLQLRVRRVKAGLP